MKKIKRLLVMTVGGTVLAVGAALIVLPGPAFIVLPLGLAILAMEFAWAKRWLRSVRALLPPKSKRTLSATRKRMSVQSIRRSTTFLLRQAGRTLLPKRKLTCSSFCPSSPGRLHTRLNRPSLAPAPGGVAHLVRE